MAPESAPTLQVCRECGGGAPVDAHFCPQCTKILSLGRHGDYFAFLGLPRKLNLEAADLERRFRDLSRQFHPDYYYNAAPAERRASLERSSYLNDAYRALRNPITRIEYLLKIEGIGTAASEHSEHSEREGRATGSDRDAFSRASTPPALLEEVFALNEELDAIREARANGAHAEQIAARLQRARQPIERKREEHERQLEELAARWDATGDRRVLDSLRDRILERNYIGNLLAGIERELTA